MLSPKEKVEVAVRRMKRAIEALDDLSTNPHVSPYIVTRLKSIKKLLQGTPDVRIDLNDESFRHEEEDDKDE